MFYVSELKGNGKVGVTDTKDGITEFYNMKDISHFINTLGLRIRGVEAYGIHITKPVKELVYLIPLRKYGTLVDCLTPDVKLVLRYSYMIAKDEEDGTSFWKNNEIELFRDYKGEYYQLSGGPKSHKWLSRQMAMALIEDVAGYKKHSIHAEEV